SLLSLIKTATTELSPLSLHAALPICGRRQRALLALFVLHHNQPVTVDRLADELWGERLPATATKTVQVYVSRLRSELGDERIQRSEEHTSELQSRENLVCRLLLEKKK